MIIGVVKEIKNHEYRVGLTPNNVKAFVKANHTILVEANAGAGAHFSDEDYIAAGATIIESSKEIYSKAEMIIKVKEPLESEYALLKEGQILFTYLHLAANPELAKVLMEKKITAIAYETIEDREGFLPCLRPMSQIAGRLSIQEGAKYIESTYGGKGILLGGIPGVERGKIVIIGGGTVGTYAAKAAIGMGAIVTILDRNLKRLEYLDDIFGSSITTLYSNSENVERCLKDADLVIGAVLIPGDKAPKIIREDYVKEMKKGAVIVDIAIDQGGICETSKATSHDDPIYIKHNVVHYCVSNMPGAVPYTATMALTNVTSDYALGIANNGLLSLCNSDNGFKKGLNIINGKCVNYNVSHALGLEYTNIEEVLK